MALIMTFLFLYKLCYCIQKNAIMAKKTDNFDQHCVAVMPFFKTLLRRINEILFCVPLAVVLSIQKMDVSQRSNTFSVPRVLWK